MGNRSIARSAASNSSVLKRQAAEAKGRVAEAFVAQHWQSHGFNILAQRMRTKAGEIDLIVADSSTLIFVEVKSRKSFVQAANAVLADHEDWGRPNIRFDIALVCNGAVEHIHDAIRPY
jgi:putative endonuclease